MLGSMMKYSDSIVSEATDIDFFTTHLAPKVDAAELNTRIWQQSPLRTPCLGGRSSSLKSTDERFILRRPFSSRWNYHLHK